jgi:phenylacetate-CoA ligase
MSQAAGIIAGTGPEGAAPEGAPGVMRCNESQFIVEAVHPETLEPVEEGEAELLLTCLDRVASPIIRFRTHDRVDVVAPGSYGHDTPLLGLRVGSIGRWDDMVKLRGNNVWPGQLDEALLGDPMVLDYRAEVVIDARGVEQLLVVVRADAAAGGGVDAHAATLARRVKACTNVRPSVSFDSSLPVPELKPKRLVDRRRQ